MKWSSVTWFEQGQYRLSLRIGEAVAVHILDDRYIKEYHYIMDVKRRLLKHLGVNNNG